jgi:hypothetical protein
MSLKTAELKIDLKALLVEVRDDQGTGAEALDVFVDKLALTIEKYVKTATINYTNGLTAGAIPVAGIFNGTLS